jgi:hypothetical protein
VRSVTLRNAKISKISEFFFSNTPIDLLGGEAPPARLEPPLSKFAKDKLFPGMRRGNQQKVFVTDAKNFKTEPFAPTTSWQSSAVLLSGKRS